MIPNSIEFEMYNEGYRTFVTSLFGLNIKNDYINIKNQITPLISQGFFREENVSFNDEHNQIYFKYGFSEVGSILIKNNIESISIKNAGNLNDSIMFGWGLYNVLQNEKEAELVENASQFLDNTSKSYIDIAEFVDLNSVKKIGADISSRVKQEELLNEIYIKNTGVVIGDMFHTEQISKQFIINHSERLKSLGVNYIFIEHFTEQMQPSLDHFFDTGEMQNDLKCYLTSLDEKFNLPCNGYNFFNLLVQIQKSKIKPIAIESTYSYAIKTKPSGLDDRRMLTMNYHLKKKHESLLAKDPNAKWIAIVGGAHINTYNHVPGISQLLRCPTIMIKQSESQKIILNHYDFKHKAQSHILLQLDFERNQYLHPIIENKDNKDINSKPFFDSIGPFNDENISCSDFILNTACSINNLNDDFFDNNHKITNSYKLNNNKRKLDDTDISSDEDNKKILKKDFSK